MQFHIGAIAEHLRTAKKREKAKAADLPLDQRLANYILEGSKDGLLADLDRKRAEGTAPLDIINRALMEGLAADRRLLNPHGLIVPQVLQFAEAMKAGVGRLEHVMEK